MEKIRLVGGVGDGLTIECDSFADVLEVPIQPRAIVEPFLPPSEAMRDEPIQRAMYRRSLRNPHVFVFQP